MKGIDNQKLFDCFKQLLDFYMEGRNDLEQEGGTVICLIKVWGHLQTQAIV